MNIGKLKQSGFPVPEGFCLSSKAYESYLEATGISDLLDAGEYYKREEELGKRLLTGKLPLAIEKEIMRAYELLQSLRE